MRKRCPRCGIVKSTDEFYKQCSKPDGFQSYCKVCRKARLRGEPLEIEHESVCGCKRCVTQAYSAVGLKVCVKCGASKPIGDFYKNRLTTSGLSSWCKTCSHASVVVSKRKTNYHMTALDLQERIADQGGSCAACGDPIDVTVSRGVYVDHDHKCCPGEKSCGKCVRGLLCVNCNTALGHIKDDPNRAMALAAYLMRFENVLGEVI